MRIVLSSRSLPRPRPPQPLSKTPKATKAPRGNRTSGMRSRAASGARCASKKKKTRVTIQRNERKPRKAWGGETRTSLSSQKNTPRTKLTETGLASQTATMLTRPASTCTQRSYICASFLFAKLEYLSLVSFVSDLVAIDQCPRKSHETSARTIEPSNVRIPSQPLSKIQYGIRIDTPASTARVVAFTPATQHAKPFRCRPSRARRAVIAISQTTSAIRCLDGCSSSDRSTRGRFTLAFDRDLHHLVFFATRDNSSALALPGEISCVMPHRSSLAREPSPRSPNCGSFAAAAALRPRRPPRALHTSHGDASS